MAEHSTTLTDAQINYYPGSNVPFTVNAPPPSSGTPDSGTGSTLTTTSEEYIQKRTIEPSKMTETTESSTTTTSAANGEKADASNGLESNSTEDSATGTLTNIPDNAKLISRTTQQVQTQQVKTVTKVYTTREIRHIGPDGQPMDGPFSETAPTTTSSNDYTNFPGPRTTSEPPSTTNGDSAAEHYAAQFHDPHYSNTNFAHPSHPAHHQLLHANTSMAGAAPSPSPGSGSTVNTGSTAVATFATAGQGQGQPRLYDPYARNSQIGYQDYSNFNNYQDLTHLDGGGQHQPPGSSPQPPIRRHMLAAAELQDPNFALQYGYSTGGGGGAPQMIQMASPGAANAAIYGNFDSGPEGYLDRRQTFDDHSPYGQMMARPGGPPPAMYEDAESAYQHLQALQQAGVMDPAQTALFFQNGMLGPPGANGPIQAVPPSRAVLAGAGAPGSSVVTAIGADGVRWRDPDLHEVIDFLQHTNSIVRANAAAYLQHLCFMDDSMKAKTRALGGIPPLVALLSQDVPEIQRNACGALRNLSFGRQNDENKRAIRNAGGIPALVRLLRKTPDNEIRELVTSVLWNLSSCEELKRGIIDEALGTLVSTVIIPHSGWERAQQAGAGSQPEIYWSTVFRNASGVLRNVSSAGSYARNKLRDVEGLVDSLLFLVRAAIGKNDMDNKSVENCVCILRNLSYRCQEVIDLNYDKNPPGVVTSPSSTSSGLASSASSGAGGGGGQANLGQSPASTLSPSSSNSSKNSTSSLMGGLSSKVGENLSCFGGSKKKSKHHSGGGAGGAHDTLSPSASVHGLESKTAQLTLNSNGRSASDVPVGRELLWQTEVVQPYLALLSECSNPETLEAAAGAIQNLAACYWQPSVDIRGAVRKEKGLPILVELLRMEVDRVVCAVATALRNLAIDTRNKELIGKYALKDLVSKLPTPSATGVPLETGTSDDTIAAVLATLNEVIQRNVDFAKSLLEAGGMQRLTLITKHRNRFSLRVVKFTSQLLFHMWQHTDLREVYRKAGWKESHFVISTTSTRSQSASGTLRNGPNSGMMTPSPSGMMLGTSPSSPTNGTLPGGSGLYHSISANNTLSRPMSTVGGTKYEDHHQVLQQLRAGGGGGNSGTLPRPGTATSQMMARVRMPEEMVMTEMNQQQQQQQAMLQAQLDNAAAAMMSNGTGTLVRPPIGGVPIFPPGAAPGEPVYAQVNRERKRQQQQAAALQQAAVQHSPSGSANSPVTHHPSGIGAPPVQPGSSGAGHQVLLDPTTNEPIYPPSMPAGDSWV